MNQEIRIISEIFAVIIIEETPKLGGCIFDISDKENRWVQVNTLDPEQLTPLSDFKVIRQELFEENLMEEAWGLLCVALTFLYRPSAIYCVTKEQLKVEYKLIGNSDNLITQEKIIFGGKINKLTGVSKI